MVSGTTDLTVGPSSSTENVYPSSSVSGLGDSVYKVFPSGATPIVDKGLGDECLPSGFVCASGTYGGAVREVGEGNGARSKRRFDECGAVKRVQGAKKIKPTPMQVQEISGENVVRGLGLDVSPATDAFSSVGFMSGCEAHPICGAVLYGSGDQAPKSPGPIGGWQGPMDLNFQTGTAMPVVGNRHGETVVLRDVGDSAAIDSGSPSARRLGLVGAGKRGFESSSSGGGCIEPAHKRQALAFVSEKAFQSMSVPQPALLVTRQFGSGSCSITDHFGAASFCTAPMSSSTSTAAHKESVIQGSQTTAIIGGDAEPPSCCINRGEVAGVAQVFGYQNQLSVSHSGRVTRLSKHDARAILHDEPVTMPSFGTHSGESSARPEGVRNEDVQGLGVGGSVACSFSYQRPAMNAGRLTETDGSRNAPRSNHPRGPWRFRTRGSPSVNIGANNSSETPVTNIQDGAGTSRFSANPTSRSNAAGPRNHHRQGTFEKKITKEAFSE